MLNMPNRLTLSIALVVSALAIPAAAATVDGIPLHSTVTGTGAKTVVLVHGWTCDATSWDAQVPALAKQYRVITLDLPGHGRSGSPKDGRFSMELFARAVEAVRAEANAARLVLVGHSMGTPVIREYARLYPQHVAALVAVDGMIAPAAAAPGAPAAGAPAAAPAMTGAAGLKQREAMVRGMFVASTPQPVQEAVLKTMLGTPEATANGARQAMFAWMATGDRTVREYPVLGIYADGSRAGNAETSKRIYPAYEHQEIPDTGHFLMMERPAEFNRRLIQFVERVK